MATGGSPPHKPQANGVLATLDNSKTSLFHFKAILISGVGFATDSYDLFSIGLLTKLIGRIYYGGHMPINISAAITGVALCGTLAGQLLFGWLGDKCGRKSVYGLTLWLMVVSSIGSACSFGRTPNAVVGTLCFWRFMLGLGVGGDYPLSATIMSEYASIKNRGAFIAAVFSCQGIGILLSAAVTLIAASASMNTSAESPVNADYVWRIVLGFSAIPTIATMYMRHKLPETPRYTIHIARQTEQAGADMSGVVGHTVVAEQSDAVNTDWRSFLKVYGGRLFGCAACWFFLDIAFYSQGLFQSDVFKTIGWVPKINVFWPSTDDHFAEPTISIKTVCSTAQYDYVTGPSSSNPFPIPGGANCDPTLRNHLGDACHDKGAGCWMSPLYETYLTARAQAIIALFSTIPGYYMCVATIECMGRKAIQSMGFFFMTLFMAILAGAYKKLLANIAWFVVLYAATFFFANWGPNTTTFVLPAEVFPTHWRSTAHGFCAACGKAGAIVGAFGFLYASKDPSNPSDLADYGNIGIGLQKSLGILAATNAIGFIINLFFVPETKGKSLEDLNGERLTASDGTTSNQAQTGKEVPL